MFDVDNAKDREQSIKFMEIVLLQTKNPYEYLNQIKIAKSILKQRVKEWLYKNVIAYKTLTLYVIA